MTSRFLRTLRRWAGTPKALSLLVIAIGLVVAAAVVAIACCDAIVVPVDGMMGADNRTLPTPTKTTVPGKNGKVYKYAIDPHKRPVVVTRNGVPWFSITNTNGLVEIRDPNGSPKVVVVKTGASAH